MINIDKLSSQDLLKKNVLEMGLCTGCGACVGLCPYQIIRRDRTVQMHRCDLIQGKCYAFCPRTEIDFNALRGSLFDAADLTSEIGAVKDYYFSRAVDPKLRKIAQHGGTVTALMELALAEGIIDAAIISKSNVDFQQSGVKVKDKTALRKNAGSKFLSSPTVAAFNEVAAAKSGKIGVVATPCQALALAKMKLKPLPDDANNINKLELVIGLYCGWTLSGEKFMTLLGQNNIDPASLTGMDIPAGKKELVIYTRAGSKFISFDHVQSCIREACLYCLDSTAEYADLSVGAARFGNNWEEMRGWNQLIVRTARGKQLVELAQKRGVIEIVGASPHTLKDLKLAASEKKKTALKNIVKKTGSAKNLLYLNCRDPFVQKILEEIYG